ncbi:MAG: tetratricopeptide repeat protein [Spirochaetaceae bacterium]|jgi:tetratricopeptide (TPR) repeat protein|nr:tetratricopeptide repeat protein [Spirochaetaceae bacterium]
MCVNTRIILAILFAVSAQIAFSQVKPDAMESYRTGRELESQGRAAESNAKYQEAVNICLNEISTGAATMDTYAVLTWALQRQNKYAEVILRGNEALNIQRDYRVIETMGEAYFYLNDFAASLRCMQRYIANVPNGDRTSVAYFFIGEIYRFQKKYNYADIAYTTAVNLTPHLALWWYRLGSAREAAGYREFARQAYERALRIDPGYVQAGEGLERTRRESA